MKKELPKEIANNIWIFTKSHSASLLTGSTIACNAAGIITTYKNSPKIHVILEDAQHKFNSVEDKEEKRKIALDTFKRLIPLVTPIIIFFTASSVSAIVNHKKSEAKIAALSAALSLAKTTIDEYDSFSNKVKEEIGEESYTDIRREVAKERAEQVVSRTTFSGVQLGEYLCCIPEYGIFFSGTQDKMNLAMERANTILSENGMHGKSYGYTNRYGDEIVRVADILDELGIHHHRPKMCDSLGWDAEKVKHINYYIDSGATETGVPYLTLNFETRAEFMDLWG